MPDINLLPSLPIGATRATSTGPLPADTTAALQRFLVEQRRAHATADEVRTADLGTTEVHRAMRQLCEEARRRGVRVEQLIVLLKQLWAALPPDTAEDRRPDGRRSRPEVLEGIVRVCIEEFYAPARGAAESAAENDAAVGA